MSLNRGRRSTRRWAGVLLGVQLLGAVVAIADARVAGASEAAPLHVEDAQAGSCVPPHDHQHCVLCQHLAHGDGVLPIRPMLRADDHGSVDGPRAADEIALPLLLDSPRTRAPPQA